MLGGTFDPIHRVHLKMAYEALNQLDLEQVWWIPAGNPWQKTRMITEAHHRFEMLKIALAHEKKFVLEPCELLRLGPTYTLDTIHILKLRYPDVEWFLLLGNDQYQNLPTWHRWQTLLQEVQVVVFNRDLKYNLQNLQEEGLIQAEAANIPFLSLDFEPDPISSTEIRRCAAMGYGLEQYVPIEVAKYIKQHDLYKSFPIS